MRTILNSTDQRGGRDGDADIGRRGGVLLSRVEERRYPMPGRNISLSYRWRF